MKEIKSWLSHWAALLLIIFGFPTLGFTWCYQAERAYSWHVWQLQMIDALNSWLHGLRFVGLILGGIPTLGLAWFFLFRFSRPSLLSKQWEKYHLLVK